ncbi:gastric inhibitory polypeptide receptor [Echinops telfairi]|uniref:Gastric inhibitory polypeptide receptor n=1 Tax=Echinops telfairi TaxID=9371 RepID=A0ABM0ZSC0_ECHTE|nr:gastric inhibitory polypeptide receptor [Echinops telfairi]
MCPSTGSEGQTTGELYQRWERYRQECLEALEAAAPPIGLACNGSFDMYACWDYAAPNATARASCPWYLPWHQQVATGFVLRQCGSDGQWGPWRDHSQCENPEKNEVVQDQRLILERLQVVYTVGYSLSLATLLLALLLLSGFRRLRCTRNYIHINLFTSFMLRAAAILTRDRLLPGPGLSPGEQAPWSQALAACRTAQVVTQYCVGANYTWLLVEGVYLHSVLVLVGGSEGDHFRCYLLLGWGEPRPTPQPGFLVSVLYCFINKEVQSEIRRGWHRCLLHRNLGVELHHQPQRSSWTLPNNLGPGEIPSGHTASSGVLPEAGDEASRVSESYC